MRPRIRSVLLLTLLGTLAGCASATDRLNDGIELQAQGRYMEAVYRYAEAVERDRELVAARERLVSAGDTAIQQAMDDADDLERRGDPVAAARAYHDIDQMLARVRQVGMRLDPPPDYGMIRRAIFDKAIGWQMVQGDHAAEEGRWEAARRMYVGAREAFLEPARMQIGESYDAEIRVLMDWAETELADGHPRAAHGLAQEAVSVRSSPARDVVLRARELQERALKAGTVIVAVLPVVASPAVREHLGPEFEIALDEDLTLDHWNEPPLFVQMADPIILRRELRGLLRGQVQQSPTLVGRAIELIGADLGVMVELSRVRITESDVDVDTHEAVIPRPGSEGRGVGRQTDTPMDTVTYRTLEGDVSYYLEADIVIVDPDGREVERFTASASQEAPFRRGEFDGDPAWLDLPSSQKPFFDQDRIAEERARIEEALLEDLALAIAAGTYDTVLAGVL